MIYSESKNKTNLKELTKMMNKQQLINTIEGIRKDSENWNILKLREVQEGIITQEEYNELRENAQQRTDAMIARIDAEIAAL